MDNRLPPLWKIKRELKRFPLSVLSKARIALSPLNRIKHDLTAHQTVKFFSGDQPESSETGVFLIYQPEKLLASTFVTLQHLADEGISVILVANHALDETKITALRPYCYKMIERPNVGYDFGGYREGVLHVIRNLPDTERLFLLNDSNWFPIFNNSDVISKSREAPENLYGFFCYTPRPPNPPHVQSYYYRVDRKLLRSKIFAGFWEKMPLVNEKRIVVRRYEFGLSKLISKNGFTLGSYYNNTSVAKALAKLPPNELKEVLQFYVECKIFKKNQKLLNLSAASLEMLSDRPTIENVLLDASEDFFFRSDHPILMLREMESPFLKKYRDKNMAAQRAQIFEHGLEKDINPIVLSELESWDD